MARDVADVFRGDPAGLGRATAIIAGLAVTATGYARGKLSWPSRGMDGVITSQHKVVA